MEEKHGASLVGGTLSTIAEPFQWSAVIINYNGAGQILNTIASIRNTLSAPEEIIVVDDGSSDTSLHCVRLHFPDVRIIALGQNTGRTSVVRNAGLAAANHRYVLVTDSDITFLPDSVMQMMTVLTNRPDAGACTPTVMFSDNPDEIYSQGHSLHFLCWSAAGSKTRPGGLQQDEPFSAIGCGIQLIDREKTRDIGGFDEKMVIGWGDDGDFHHQLRIAGLACYAVPGARVLHTRIRITSRYYGQIHNRLIILFKSYELRTLIIIAPALIAFEIILALYLTASGHGGDYMRAVADVWRLRAELLQDRRRVQALRRCPDCRILVAGALALPKTGEASGTFGSAALIGRVLGLYWGVCGLFLEWTA